MQELTSGEKYGTSLSANLSKTIEDWTHLASTLQNRLQKITANSEQEFLAIGAQIQEFADRAKELFNISSSIVDSMSGSQIITTIQGLQKTLTDVSQYIQHLESKMDSSIKALCDASGIIREICKILAGFKKTFKKLNMLSLSTKIESIRLIHSYENFESLAADVSKLAQLIDSKSLKMRSESQSLNEFIREALSNIQLAIADRQGKTHLLLQEMEKRIELLRQKQDSSSVVSQQISTSLENISKNINDVVMSLQFHDITRQKIEHVCESLKDIHHNLNHSFTRKEDLPSHRQNELIIWSAKAFQLQSAQLKNTKAELRSALAHVCRDLQEIGDNVANISKDIQSLSGTTDESNASFFTEMEQRLASIALSLEENGRTGSEMLNAMVQVGKTVKDLSIFISDIEEIGSEIELIAVNAQVKAARAGQDGASLGVIAEAIQNLSINARSETQKIAQMFTEVSSIGHKLSAECEKDFHEIELESSSMINDIRKMLKSLQNINQNMVADLSHLNKISLKLAIDIHDTVSFITEHDEFENSLAEAILEIDRAIRYLQERISEYELSNKAISFANLASRYTMQSERKIHETHIQKTESTLPSQEEAKMNEDPDDDTFGDNIEFF